MRIGITVIILFVTIVLTLIPMPNTATAQLAPTTSTLYGVTSFGGGAGFAPGCLLILSPASGAAAPPLGFPCPNLGEAAFGWPGGGCQSIDFHPVTGVLYGICFDTVLGDSVLVTISTITGGITSVIAPLGTFVRTPGMSFHPTTGVLYASSFAPGFGSQELFTVALVGPGPLATPVSPFSLGPGFFGGGNAIAFNAAGTLFFMAAGIAVNEVYTVSLTTEVLTSLPGGLVFPAVDPAHSLPYAGFPPAFVLPFGASGFARINAAEFDPATGLLATIVNDGGGGGSGYYLSGTSPAGAGTAHVGITTPRMDGLAFEPIPLVVGGVGIPIDTTALLIAGVQSSTMWMIPVLAFIGIAGLVIFKIKSKANQS